MLCLDNKEPVDMSSGVNEMFSDCFDTSESRIEATQFAHDWTCLGNSLNCLGKSAKCLANAFTRLSPISKKHSEHTIELV